MSGSFKKYVPFLYFIAMIILFYFNAVYIVEWLNKTLFPDFVIDHEKVRESFKHGTSIIFMLTLGIYAVMGSFLVSVLVSDLLFFGLIAANTVKVMERNEFITFSELQTITSPKELLSFVEIPVWSAVAISIGVVVLLAILQYFSRKLARRWQLFVDFKVRIPLFLIAIAFMTFLLMKPNYINEHYFEYVESNSHNFNPVTRAQKDGFIPSFVHTIDPHYMEKPSNYTKETMDEIDRRYKKAAKKVNKNRHQSIDDAQTILYLSESLMDPGNLPKLLNNGTSIPFVTKMMKDNVGGTMYSQYIGGGTANIEWSLLTSFSLEVFRDPISITPYSDFYMDSPNHDSILTMLDKDTIAIHPYTAHLYKRKSVYDAMNFDDFIYLNHGIRHTEKLGTHTRVSDKALNKDIFRYLGEENIGLMNVLSMQNHTPYNGEIPSMTYQPAINLDLFPKEKEKELYNYLQGTKASDHATRELVKKIDSSSQEINLLFYGDHFPSPFRGLEDQFTKKQLHETPWFLYMNKDRNEKEHAFEGISPAFLVPVLLKEGSYYVTPFQGLMDQLLEQGVKRIGNDFIVTDQGKVKDADLGKDLSLLVQDYRTIMYDALFGKNILDEAFYAETFH